MVCITILDNEEASGIALVTIVRNNFQDFTKKQIKGAIKARDMQAMLGHLSWHFFEHTVSARLISNCFIAPNDISTACTIFMKNLAGIRGKTV